MAVRIRLTRVGATKRPAYRVIAIDKRRSRDGRALEILGYYDPLTEPATVQLDTAKIQAWIGKGAQPSDTVVKLMQQSERAATQGQEAAPKPKRASRAAASKPSKKAQAKATAAAETPAEPTDAAAVDDTGTPTAGDDDAASPEAVTEPAAEAGTEPAAEPPADEPAAAADDTGKAEA